MRNTIRALFLLSVAFAACDKTAWRETASGLRYRDTEVGDGRAPAKGDYVGVLYRGWIESTGEEFDKLEDPQRPFRFALGAGQVIQGWDEGLAGMRSGGVRELLIPPELAYGAEGSGPIPPDSTLRFQITLLQVQPAPKPWAISGKPIQETPSGLKYVVYDEGQGESPVPGQMVVFHSSGFFEDGTLFDSSRIRATPVHFQIGSGDAIPGWEEGLRLMKPYARYKLILPPHLAYGKEGAGPIPPNATLHFDVQLLQITDPADPGFAASPGADALEP